MEYILKARPRRIKCFLCAGIREKADAKNHILIRSDHSFCILNKYPYVSGHAMVAPLRHVDSIEKLEAEEGADMFRVINRILSAMRAEMNPHGFNIGANLGRVAGAGLETHVHFHVVPRWNGDTNFMPVVGDLSVIPESLDATYRKLRKRLDSQRG